MKTTKLTRLVQVDPARADRRISNALRCESGDVRETARQMGVSTRTLYRILAKRKQPRELARRLQAGIR